MEKAGFRVSYNQEFNFRHIKFEMPIRYLSGDVN